jgi:LmbE family N-acetylglucosaminyl deacetylase
MLQRGAVASIVDPRVETVPAEQPESGTPPEEGALTMNAQKKGHRLLCFGAHPDDCEIQASGLAALWTGVGGVARFVSMTDGSSGHQELGGAKLARIRRAEAVAGAAAVGADSLILDNQDGSLLPTLQNRHKVIRTIREFQPDVIVCHRINDYHPDHRYTGVTVQDACYMVMVPNVLPNAPVPAREPAVIFMSDKFNKPNPFQADLVFDLDPVIEKKLDSITDHASQTLEWLPWIHRYFEELPQGEHERREYARARAAQACAAEADRFRSELVARYGEARGRSVRYAEAFEVSEYGAPLTDELSDLLSRF